MVFPFPLTVSTFHYHKKLCSSLLDPTCCYLYTFTTSIFYKFSDKQDMCPLLLTVKEKKML